MPIITVSTEIAAEVGVCFDLARSVEAHIASTRKTHERAVAGVTTGLLGPGDEVTWRARHLGVVQELTSRITRFDRPGYFRDEMVRGVFVRFVHDHYFEPTATGTIVRDVLDYSSPFGLAGRLVERVYLNSYLSTFLADRARALKHFAESGQWRAWLNEGWSQTRLEG